MKFDRVYTKQISGGAISKHADIIKTGIAAAFADATTKELLTNMMSEVFSGKLQAWFIIGEHDKTASILGIMTTRIINDSRWQRRALYIETLNAIQSIPRTCWQEGLDRLVEFAKINECDSIEADIANDVMLGIVESIGFTKTGYKVARAI